MSMRWNRNSIQIVHKPTGIVAVCESDRSQHRNKAKALNLLRARLWAAKNVPKVETVVRNYFEQGCKCIEEGSLPKLPASESDDVAAHYYKDNCKCSRNDEGIL